MNDLTGGQYNHGGRHGARGLDRIPLGSLVAGDDTVGEMFYVDANKEVARLEIVANGAVLGSGTIPAWKTDVPISGYVRIGSTTAPTNTTAGDLTAVRILAGNATLASGVVGAFTGNVTATGWTRVGSASAPTNTTAGDLTAVRVLAGDATLASGVVGAFAGNVTATGYSQVGSATAPSNTTAGDLTAVRGHFGTDGAFTSGKILEAVGDAKVSGAITIGGALDHDGSTVGVFGVSPATRQTVNALTNNVTSGGSADTIANYTDLVIYANDSAAIRNDLYRLAVAYNSLRTALLQYGLVQ